MLSRIAALLPLCSHANGFAEGALCADASTTLTNNSSASLNGTMQYLKIIAERFTYHFAVAAWRTNEAECALGMKYWEIGFDTASVFFVRIKSGNRILRTPNRDVVVMDDFIYGEPQLLP
jgi:hypothetical protein